MAYLDDGAWRYFWHPVCTLAELAAATADRRALPVTLLGKPVAVAEIAGAVAAFPDRFGKLACRRQTRRRSLHQASYPQLHRIQHPLGDTPLHPNCSVFDCQNYQFVPSPVCPCRATGSGGARAGTSAATATKLKTGRCAVWQIASAPVLSSLCGLTNDFAQIGATAPRLDRTPRSPAPDDRRSWALRSPSRGRGCEASEPGQVLPTAQFPPECPRPVPARAMRPTAALRRIDPDGTACTIFAPSFVVALTAPRSRHIAMPPGATSTPSPTVAGSSRTHRTCVRYRHGRPRTCLSPRPGPGPR